jgi:hypothetical protein
MVINMALNPKILFINNGPITMPRALQFIKQYVQVVLESTRQVSGTSRGFFPPMYFFLLGNAYI